MAGEHARRNQRDEYTAQRAAQGEEPAAGEEGPGLDEAGFRRRFAYLLDDAGAA